MAQSEQSKQKLLSLLRIFWERTSPQTGLTLEEIQAALAADGISAERKSVYTDIRLLQEFGLTIEKRQENRRHTYHLTEHLFSLSELKLLTDAIGSSRSIPEGKSREIVRKLKLLTDRRTSRALDRQITVTGRVKQMNEAVLQNIDLLQTAIQAGRQISFGYWEWTVNKEQVLRHGGRRYQLSPWTLLWEDENYYLLAYNAETDSIRHYRVDRMTAMEICDSPREGQAAFDALDFTSYSRGMFGMFGGTPEPITLRCENTLAGIIIERFGKNPTFFKEADGAHFTVTVRVVPCDLFWAWVIGFGGRMQIIEPASARVSLEKMARAALIGQETSE